MRPKLVEGYRKMPVVRDNPNWWMIEIFDGFGFHICNLKAPKHCYDNKIFSIKGQGGTFHVNQSYDRLVTNSDKAVHRDSLGCLCDMNIFNQNVVDQLLLVHC